MFRRGYTTQNEVDRKTFFADYLALTTQVLALILVELVRLHRVFLPSYLCYGTDVFFVPFVYAKTMISRKGLTSIRLKTG